MIGSASTVFKKNVITVVEDCYSSVITQVVHVTKPMLSLYTLDLLPALQKSSVIYKYKCHCNSRYKGMTSQRLQDQVKQHVLKWLI